MSRPRPLYALVCLLPALVACGTKTSTATSTPVDTPVAKPSIWVGAWGASMTNAQPSTENSGGTDETFRFLVYPTVAGTQERVHFSNIYGTTPVTIGAARLAVGQDGSPAINPSQDAALSFSGQPSVTIAPGQVVVSDAVNVSYTFGQALAVTVYLKGAFGSVSRHNSLFMTNYHSASGAGDQTSDAKGTSLTGTQADWFLLNEIDVYGTYQGTIALFGSSTTDGFHSDYSSTQVYPVANAPVAGQHTSRTSDWLAERLNAAGYQIGIVNEGISGDTITADPIDQANDILDANQRFAQDVLSVPGLLGVVSYFGAIDLRAADCKSAPAIESATQQLVQASAAAHVPVVLATLPPSAFCSNPAEPNFGPSPSAAAPFAGGAVPGPINGAETQRLAFNAWVRSTGSALPGVAGVADYDRALADPANPDFLLALYNSGDNFHPNGAGYKAQAAVIPYSALIP